MVDGGGLTHLADGVHAELGGPEVDGGDAQLGGHDGANGGATRRVVLHHKVLHRDSCNRKNPD